MTCAYSMRPHIAIEFFGILLAACGGHEPTAPDGRELPPLPPADEILFVSHVAGGTGYDLFLMREDGNRH